MPTRFDKDVLSWTGAGASKTTTDRAGTSSDPYLDVGSYDDIAVSGIFVSTTNTLTKMTAKLMGYTASTGGSTTTLASITGMTSEVSAYGTPFAIEIEGAKLGDYHYIAIQGTLVGTDPEGVMKTFYRLGNPRHGPVTQTQYGSTTTSVG